MARPTRARICGCCGGPKGWELRPVRVTPRLPSAPDVATLTLCSSCASPDNPDRAWRRRWAPVEI